MGENNASTEMEGKPSCSCAMAREAWWASERRWKWLVETERAATTQLAVSIRAARTLIFPRLASSASRSFLDGAAEAVEAAEAVDAAVGVRRGAEGARGLRAAVDVLVEALVLEAVEEAMEELDSPMALFFFAAVAVAPP